MFPHREYAQERVAQVAARLAARIRAERKPVELELAGPVGRISRTEARTLDYRPAAPAEPLGPLFATYWARGRIAVPASWAGARVDLGSTRAARRRCGSTDVPSGR